MRLLGKKVRGVEGRERMRVDFEVEVGSKAVRIPLGRVVRMWERVEGGRLPSRTIDFRPGVEVMAEVMEEGERCVSIIDMSAAAT